MSEVRCAYDELVPIERLIPNPRNPNIHPKRQIEVLAKVIDHQGWRAPVTVSTRSGFIVRGHCRYEAAKVLRCDCPVDYQDYANEAEEWADLIADNRIAELSELDRDLLADLMKEIDALSFDLELTGFGVNEINDLLSCNIQIEGLTDPDLVPERPKTPASRLGDLWILGEHRLLCGDAVSWEDTGRLISGEKVQMVFTDPPYNVDYEGTAGKIKNDNLNDREFYSLLVRSFSNFFNSLIDGGAIYVCYSDSEAVNFRKALAVAGFKLSTCLVWKKNHFVLGRSDYQCQHEPILYGWKPTGPHRWFGGRKKSTIHEFFPGSNLTRMGDDQYQVQLGDNAFIITGREIMVEEVLTTIISENKPLVSDLHPTMKPVSLINRFISNSSKPGETVSDFFGGSGSTLIGCVQTGRICKMMELDPVNVDVIVTRWQDFTGRDATLQGDGRTFLEVSKERIKVN
jgi:DNA modification methylase